MSADLVSGHPVSTNRPAANAIEVHNLTMRFGKFTAVDRINFTVKEGTVFGFLGANGAGKSTTIRMLCGLLQPTEGSAVVGGFDIRTQTDDLKQNIGYMSQRFSLYDDLTVEQNIRFYGGVYGIENSRLKNRLDWVLGMANLRGSESRLTRTLSGGWKQRLALGCAILHEPKILFLDEPTGSVDPVSRRNFWELINTLSSQGITVLVTTHFLDEAEYCNDIVLINAGKIIAAGSPSELKLEYIYHPILEVTCDRVIEALEIIRRQPWALETTIFGTQLHVMVDDEAEGKRLISEALRDKSISVQRLERIVPSLEDVFLFLLEQGVEKGGGKEAA